MKQAVFHFLVLIFAFLVAIGVYAWSTEQGPDRYDLFDFFRGQPIPIAVPPLLPEADAEAEERENDEAKIVPAATSAGIATDSLLLLAQFGSHLQQTPRAVPLVVDPDGVRLMEQINRGEVHRVEAFYEILGGLPADQTAVLILSRRGQRYHVLLAPGG